MTTLKEYRAELKKLGINWRQPSSKEIACHHQWDRPERKGETRTCVKCGGKQTN